MFFTQRRGFDAKGEILTQRRGGAENSEKPIAPAPLREIIWPSPLLWPWLWHLAAAAAGRWRAPAFQPAARRWATGRDGQHSAPARLWRRHSETDRRSADSSAPAS